MTELILLPTANWFTSRPIDISRQNGYIGLSAINSIIISTRQIDKYKHTIKEAHTKRIHSISFYDLSEFTYLASCSEDLDVKVWNFETRCLVNQHRFHQNSPVCLDWLRFNNQSDLILISCDIKGNIFKWNLSTNQHYRFFPENKPITQCKSKDNSYIVAVGYNQGTIVILDVESNQMKILYKLKNHEDCINCLSWFPVCSLNSYENELDIKDGLFGFDSSAELANILCSSAEDKTIRFWSISNGSQLKCLKTPGSSQQQQSSSSSKSSKQTTSARINYTPLCWPNSKYLVTGTYKGDIFVFDLLNDWKKTEEIELNKCWRPFTPLKSDRAHKKAIFDISHYDNSIITMSLDRLINIWSLTNFKQTASLTTLNGFVYCISSSPIDPNLICLSLGDSSLKIINQKNNEKHVKSFVNNIKSEVTQVCWHPVKESLVAFGTKDGKIGIADTMSPNKPAQYIYTNYNQSIYTLFWNIDSILPSAEEVTNIKIDIDKQKKISSNCWYLYSVSDGKIMQHEIMNYNFQIDQVKSIDFYKKLINEPNNNINNSNNSNASQNKYEHGITEFTLLRLSDKQDKYYLLVGKYDGSIELFDNSYKKLCTFFNHQKLITCLKFNQHQASTENSTNILFASGSNDQNVVIIDFKQLIDELETRSTAKSDETNQVKFFSKYKHKLSGHKDRITSLSWCSNVNLHLLASCSYDCTVQIWNALEGTALVNYRGHSDKLLCCMFSPADSNIVYSGGEDYSLHRWQIDAQTFKLPPDEYQTISAKKKANKSNTKKSTTKKDETGSEDTYDSLDQPTSVEPFSTNEATNNNANMVVQKKPSASKQQALTNQTNVFQQQRELKTIFLLSSHGSKTPKSKLKDCLTLFEQLYEKNDAIKQTLNNFVDEKKYSHIKKYDFKFDLYKFGDSLTLDQINIWPFLNRAATLKTVALEQNELKKQNYEKYWLFDVWRGNLIKLINEMKSQNNLNDFLILLYQLSLNDEKSENDEVRTSYVQQLQKSSKLDQINKAALISIASYKIEQAIECYLSQNLFQYALCLAQIRLPPGSPILYDVLEKYANYTAHNGDYETAAMCFVRMSDFENAYKQLSKRDTKNDIEMQNSLNTILTKLENLLPK